MAQRFAGLRLSTGMSMRQLAEEAGLSHSVVARAERGGPIRPKAARALVAVLGPAVWDAVSLWPPEPESDVLIVTLRHARRESRRRAAARIGVSVDVLARAESGKGVHPANAKRIADAYGIDVLDVLPVPRQEGPETTAAA